MATDDLNAICWDSASIYMTTTSGLYIYNVLDLENYQYFIPIEGGANSLWCDTNNVYIATNTGIYELDKCTPTGFTIYAEYPFINSNTVRHIHGNSNIILSCTDVGINITRRSSKYTTYCYEDNSTKCFVSGNNSCYYTTNSSGIYSVNKLINNNSNWVIPDLVYSAGNSFLPANITINDVFVSDNELLFVATNSGIYIYDELNDDYYVFGESNNYNSVTADKNSSINVGYMYASTVDPVSSFSVVNLWTKEVTDYYSTNSSGRANSPLVKDGVYDFDVNI